MFKDWRFWKAFKIRYQFAGISLANRDVRTQEKEEEEEEYRSFLLGQKDLWRRQLIKPDSQSVCLSVWHQIQVRRIYGSGNRAPSTKKEEKMHRLSVCSKRYVILYKTKLAKLFLQRKDISLWPEGLLIPGNRVINPTNYIHFLN